MKLTNKITSPPDMIHSTRSIWYVLWYILLIIIIIIIIFSGSAAQRGLWPPRSRSFVITQKRRATVGRTPLDEWSARRRDLYLITHNTHNWQTSMPPVRFEPTVATGERPYTYDLDRAATGTGIHTHTHIYFFFSQSDITSTNIDLPPEPPCLTFWLRDAPTSITFNNCTFCPHCIYVFCKQRFVPLTA
jgi:hypothetical protein